MIIKNIVEMTFDSDVEKHYIEKFRKDHPDWSEVTINNFVVFTHSKTNALSPDDRVGVACKCGNCLHAKTQTLSSGTEQLVCETSSDWRIVHPEGGCNFGSPIE